MSEKNDERTTTQLMKEWRKLQEVRRSLIRDGLINGDAKPDEVLAALRKAIPPSVFTAS